MPQVHFSFDYSGGLQEGRTPDLEHVPRTAARPYDGPKLVWLVNACKAPDGSYWALQRWQRLLPMRGIPPFLPQQAAFELHVSHWSGPLPVLEVSQNWTYGGRWQGLFGRLTYLGRPAYGFRTPSSRQRDPYARFFYVDTFNSVFGPGWKHDAGKVAHSRNGAFCYIFVPQWTPAGVSDARAAAARERRAPPGHRDGPGRDARAPVGGASRSAPTTRSGRGLQRALRPARRPRRQGLRARALAPRIPEPRGRAERRALPIPVP